MVINKNLFVSLYIYKGDFKVVRLERWLLWMWLRK